MTKDKARKIIKLKKSEIGNEDVYIRSEKIINHIYELKEFKLSDNVLSYVNYNQEVVTKNLIEKSIEMGKKVYVPKVYGKEMKFHQIMSLEDLKPGKFGILEPCNEPEEEGIEGFMVMPGIAFDKCMNRVGYGGGYYDRYLAKNKNIFKAAVCYDFQMVDYIKTEEYDLKPDIIVTESKIYRR